MVNMADVSRREAVYDINRYLATRIEEHDPAMFENQLPFWPTQSTPGIEVPYVLYVTRETVDGESWWMRIATVAYAVHSFDFDQSAHIVNLMVDLLGRGDESAQELMSWRAGAVGWDGGPYPNDYLFHTIEFMGGYNTEPADEEAGAHVRFATFRYRYSPQGGTSIA